MRLSDGFSTGSSLMPQKRNPDVAELVRGKAGRLVGNLVSLLTLLKGLPTGYNRDLQEDKEGLFDAADTLTATLEAFAGMLRDAEVDEARMQAAASHGSLLATDLADYLVAKGIPFREAHAAVSTLCDVASARNVGLTDLSIEELRAESAAFDADVYAITALASTQARDVVGGTAPARVAAALHNAKRRLADAAHKAKAS